MPEGSIVYDKESNPKVYISMKSFLPEEDILNSEELDFNGVKVSVLRPDSILSRLSLITLHFRSIDDLSSPT